MDLCLKQFQNTPFRNQKDLAYVTSPSGGQWAVGLFYLGKPHRSVFSGEHSVWRLVALEYDDGMWVIKAVRNAAEEVSVLRLTRVFSLVISGWMSKNHHDGGISPLEFALGMLRYATAGSTFVMVFEPYNIKLDETYLCAAMKARANYSLGLTVEDSRKFDRTTKAMFMPLCKSEVDQRVDLMDGQLAFVPVEPFICSPPSTLTHLFIFHVKTICTNSFFL